MFSSAIYQQRRQRLTEQLDGGLILLLGNLDSPFNSRDNSYRFRQDSSFLYFCGLDHPGLAVVLDIEAGHETLFGHQQTLEETIWSGEGLSLKSQAEQVGLSRVGSLGLLSELLKRAVNDGRPLHYLPSCRVENRLHMSTLLGVALAEIETNVSKPLIRAVINLRSIKNEEEIKEMDAAAELGYQLHTTAMQMAKPGVYEWEIAGALESLAARAGRMLSFPPIVTVHGEILHNHQRDSQLQTGDLLLVDAGVESTLHYASDHTRTHPVGGAFSSRQSAIYAVVIACLERARELIQPGIPYLDVHLAACRTLVEGLQDLGLMHGDVEQAVTAGAHALFMPHGLGHMLGLDVHDMEDLGEDAVGYDQEVRRSDQFGTSRLRLGRRLQKGFTLTVEPGIYFIPKLIEQWKNQGRYSEFINYSKLEGYLNFGGIRLEDDVLVTSGGNRVLGKPLPLQPDEIRQILLS